MKILVTCGPSFEPMDGARRLTNMSTGSLGVLLSRHLSDAGYEVICLKGEGSTSAVDPGRATVISFGTNEDLVCELQRLACLGGVGALFHAAALCDYRVGEVLNESGERLESKKYATRSGGLLIRLVPAVKVLPKLRAWFPDALIVGWKYELEGYRREALAKAQQQLIQCQTDLCVVNGAAYGPGFGILGTDGDGEVEEIPDRTALAEHLTRMVGKLDLSPV